jgi:class 3 adenylate cyclase
MQRRIVALTRRIVTGDLSRKLEVSDGAVGALCHAVNGLLQQRRVQERLQALLPALPVSVHQRLLDDPASMRFGQNTPLATVLLVGRAGPGARNPDDPRKNAAVCLLLAEEAQQQAGRYGALMQLCGESLLLVFGALEPQSRAAGLQAALETAQALRQRWDEAGPLARGRLSLSIASGNVVAGVLPGLGYSAFGPPIEQALRLQHLAAACPEYALLCSEDAYASLRRATGSPEPAVGAATPAEWLPTDLRLLQPGRPPQAVYALPV